MTINKSQIFNDLVETLKNIGDEEREILIRQIEEMNERDGIRKKETIFGTMYEVEGRGRKKERALAKAMWRDTLIYNLKNSEHSN